ncbi:hypothetical protein QJS04_geneDACA024669 [Acorus gramineus]|uniref:Uncharacterized protein n=1 Tax=Acorus gramineus TaxID=55184 RepID=A0AAV9A018_ACOGR|nr:hypothetical protein QJS04_geneDACA024669 [Acorus gramineus]
MDPGSTFIEGAMTGTRTPSTASPSPLPVASSTSAWFVFGGKDGACCSPRSCRAGPAMHTTTSRTSSATSPRKSTMRDRVWRLHVADQKAYDLLRTIRGLSNAELAETSDECSGNFGDIFNVKDELPEEEDPVNKILNKMGMKGTGKWKVQ